MENRKVNKEIYTKVKAILCNGNYTINDVQATLEWIIAEFARKWASTRDTIAVRDIDDLTDRYDDFHRFEDRPEQE